MLHAFNGKLRPNGHSLWKLPSPFRMVASLIPYRLRLPLPPKFGSQMHTQDQLRDACCYLGNIIEDIGQISFAYDSPIEGCRLLPNYYYYCCYCLMSGLLFPSTSASSAFTVLRQRAQQIDLLTYLLRVCEMQLK